MQDSFVDIINDEDILLKRLQKGDKEIYRILFDTYFRLLCLYATSLIRDRAQAEDIVQNVFLNLWIKKDTLEVKTSIKSYLYKSVYNLFINEYRRAQRNESILDTLHHEVLEQSIHDEEYSIQRKLEWINKEIDLLPPKSKEIFVLNKRRGLSYEEIAQMLDISKNTVDSHISRTLKRLRLKVPKALILLILTIMR